MQPLSGSELYLFRHGQDFIDDDGSLFKPESAARYQLHAFSRYPNLPTPQLDALNRFG